MDSLKESTNPLWISYYKRPTSDLTGGGSLCCRLSCPSNAQNSPDDDDDVIKLI
ncbi:hypothetical protein DPMN_050167 [Dreissena polymorpha]|uniref:Uncharacterized protein n=1 Tax=Dreissena polymorpha TaxID=45954 RepID=A0A9D4CGP2_DREPO|nr:hypothetical protein DPMN_050167 [Dreissena polymorpha]